MDQLTPFDRAVAIAEVRLRKALDRYRNPLASIGKIRSAADMLVPEWIDLAAHYLRTVLNAYVTVLNSSEEAPLACKAALEEKRDFTIVYLFREYFYAYAAVWDIVLDEEADEDEFFGQINQSTFRYLVLSHVTKDEPISIAEFLRQTITAFWERRAGSDSQNPEPPSEGEGSSDNQVVVTTENEKTRRKSLLEKYKTATKVQSNKRIYEAKNSGIHKPDFYAWINGELSSESAMSINFERFLRLQNLPIPRNPGKRQ